jgi:hypothetical protein
MVPWWFYPLHCTMVSGGASAGCAETARGAETVPSGMTDGDIPWGKQWKT